MNKVTLFGRLGRDPELRTTTSQMQVCTLRVATSERKKVNGDWADHTEWHQVIVFGNRAANCEKYLSKGSGVIVEGRIQTRKWQDKEGHDRYSTEIVANDVTFTDTIKKKEELRPTLNDSYKGVEGSYVQAPPAMTAPSFDDDDIPF